MEYSPFLVRELLLLMSVNQGIEEWICYRQDKFYYHQILLNSAFLSLIFLSLIDQGSVLMYFYTILFYSLFLLFIITFILAINGRPALYWIAALSIYVCSFLGGFSIGQITVGLTFIPLTLGIASVFGLMKKRYQSALFAGVGLIIGVFAVIFIGNELFYPIFKFFS